MRRLRALSRFAPTDVDAVWSRVRERRPQTLAVSHPDYLGVTHSTRTLFPEWSPLRECDLSTPARRKAATDALIESGVERLVVSAFADGYATWVDELHRRHPRLEILALWHGSTLQNAEACNRRFLREIVERSQDKRIARVGFLKQGMAELMQRAGVDAHFVMNWVDGEAAAESRPRESQGRLQLGLWFAGEAWRKNPYAMLSAAALLDEVEVSGILDEAAVDWCRMLHVALHRVHPRALPHADLLRHLTEMHCNLYVTLSECSPLLPLESLSVGTPCLVGPTSHLFEGCETLERALVIDRIDDPQAIARGIRRAVDERTSVIAAYRTWAPAYRDRARAALARFLEA